MKLVLKYFGIKGGRAFPIRLALLHGNVAHEFQGLTYAEFGALKSEFNFGQLPVIEVDGQQIAQSATILRFAGKLAGLYPTDNVKAALVDEIIDSTNDVIAAFTPSMRMKDQEEKLKARKELNDVFLPVQLAYFERILSARGPEYFAGELTIADFAFHSLHRMLTDGNLDGIDVHVVDKFPNLSAHAKRISELPVVQKYLSS